MWAPPESNNQYISQHRDDQHERLVVSDDCATNKVLNFNSIAFSKVKFFLDLILKFIGFAFFLLAILEAGTGQ